MEILKVHLNKDKTTLVTEHMIILQISKEATTPKFVRMTPLYF